MSSPAPTEVVQRLLENTLDPGIVRDLVAPDATYISLNYSNSDLARILPYAGTHTKGPRLPYLQNIYMLVLMLTVPRSSRSAGNHRYFRHRQ